MSDNAAIPVLDIVSDVVCPWCYVGKRRLERALATLEDFPLTVRWRPYELNPTLPRAGMDRREYCERKFGSLDQARRLYARVEAAAAEEDLPMHVERIARTPNTRSAHRLVELAAQHGCQDAVVDGLFEAYFVAGRDVGDPATLRDIGVAAGLVGEAIDTMLSDATGDAHIEAAERAAREAGVDGVPAFLYNGRLLFSGAQSPETIALALKRARARGL